MRYHPDHIILICQDCGKKHRRHYLAKRCFPCVRRVEKERAGKYQERYSEIRKIAMYETAKAIRLGSLSRLSLNEKIKCIDCGSPAKHYDHRDYSKPLDVDPVCVSCNAKRGPGKYAFKEQAY